MNKTVQVKPFISVFSQMFHLPIEIPMKARHSTPRRSAVKNIGQWTVNGLSGTPKNKTPAVKVMTTASEPVMNRAAARPNK